jgi:two-component system sensor histidine kinase HydH
MTVRIQLNIDKLRAGIPPLLVIGSVVVLFPIFAFMTLRDINRQNENSVRLLLEKGAALIRSFEAGTRTGMRGKWRRDFQLQNLLSETAQQPDIIYLLVAERDGRIVAHSSPNRIGGIYGQELNLDAIAESVEIQWRRVTSPEGERIFEVFRKFSPTEGPGIRHRGPMMPRHHFRSRSDDTAYPALFPDQIIFVGLDMGPVEAARVSDTRHTLIMGFILLLIGFTGIILLFLAWNYRAAKDSLSRVQAFSDNLVENMPIGLVAIDDGKRIASLNTVAGAVLGISSGAVGETARYVLPDALWNQIAVLQEGGKVEEREIECFLNNGRTVPLETTASVLYNQSGTCLGYVLLFKDLSEVHTLRKEIARSQRLASVGKLAAGVAHEIRNPLSSIKGFATYFKERYKEKSEDRHIATIMIQEVDRLNRVVGQLLEFARPISISKKSTSVRSLVEDSLKLVERQASEKHIAIETGLDSDIGYIFLDPDQMNQVLLNLYLNAVESMPTGGTMKVILGEDPVNGRVKIAVSDTGAGIAEEDIAHIFDPYYTTKASGTGLGLAIVHNIVEAHDGDIDVESRIGLGTTITLGLPRG